MSDSDEFYCARCKEPMWMVRDEPSPECDECAQTCLEEVRAENATLRARVAKLEAQRDDWTRTIRLSGEAADELRARVAELEVQCKDLVVALTRTNTQRDVARAEVQRLREACQAALDELRARAAAGFPE